MSMRSFRIRLDRLTRSAKSAIGQERDHACDFTIEPAIAKALRDDYERHNALFHKNRRQGEHGEPPNAGGIEKERMLRARIAERARAIGCPPGYGQRECFDDENRLHKFSSKRMSPPLCGGGPFSEAEDAEEAQLRARVVIFNEIPEGRARHRLKELDLKKYSELSTTEQSELDGLKALYPFVPRYLNDPMESNYEAWRAAAEKAPEDPKKSMQQLLNRIARRRTGD
jgi:hypothetical protein